MVVEFLVAIEVKVCNERLKVVRFELSVAIFTLELTKLVLVEQAFVLSINASECCEGLKIPLGAELLPNAFDLRLALGGVGEDVFEFKFRLVPENHSCS